MDDLGAGYASLSMLADLQPNYLKPTCISYATSTKIHDASVSSVS